jgi:hypothetical protein
MNQCDGCRRGLPLRGRIHFGPEGYDLIACTADRYANAETVAETMRKQLDVFADASGENRTPTTEGHGILSPRAK